MNTNYRLYYEKDNKFYISVLEQEEVPPGGHEFKLQLFKVDSLDRTPSE